MRKIGGRRFEIVVRSVESDVDVFMVQDEQGHWSRVNMRNELKPKDAGALSIT